MANMHISDHNQSERATLSETHKHIRRGSERGSMVYTLLAIPVAIILCYAALKAMEGWAQWLVLAVIVLTTYAWMRAIGPERKGAGHGATPPAG
jgi:hypothetical protein